MILIIDGGSQLLWFIDGDDREWDHGTRQAIRDQLYAQMSGLDVMEGGK